MSERPASVRPMTAAEASETSEVPQVSAAGDEPTYLTATRAGYDTVAASYADLLAAELDRNPFDRAVLALFADLVRGSEHAADGRVVEIGCGPGRITAHLVGLGLAAFGIDLSPAMVEQALQRHPGIEFQVGEMSTLSLPPDALAGLVAWYSLIHVPPARHPNVLAGFHRVLARGGHLLLAFHAGDERRHITDAYGHTGLSIDSYRLPPDRVEDQAVAAGFHPVARLTREPIGPEKTGQAYVILRKVA